LFRKTLVCSGFHIPSAAHARTARFSSRTPAHNADLAIARSGNVQNVSVRETKLLKSSGQIPAASKVFPRYPPELRADRSPAPGPDRTERTSRPTGRRLPGAARQWNHAGSVALVDRIDP
jgi:hypothetical protein